MNEVQILSAFVSKPRQFKKINGVMTPVYIKPYDKKYNYTTRFKNFNNILLKQGLTNTIVYDNSLIYNRAHNTFEKRSQYYKKKKLKQNLKTYLRFDNDIVYVNPAIVDLNNRGVLYTYSSNFRQAPGTAWHTVIYKYKIILRQYVGSRILVKASLNDIGWEKETTYDIPNLKAFKKWFDTEKPWLFIEITSGEYIFDYDYNHDIDDSVLPIDKQARMRIWVINNVYATAYAQAFANSVVNHCVLQPVRDYLEFRIEKAKNKETSTIKKYNAAMNKLINWEFKYPVGKGIPISKLHQFCGETGFGIDLYLPGPSCEGRNWKTYRPPKQPTKIFKFINTSHNHLDITAQVDNNFRETITQEQYDELLNTFHNSNDYYIYNKFCII